MATTDNNEARKKNPINFNSMTVFAWSSNYIINVRWHNFIPRKVMEFLSRRQTLRQTSQYTVYIVFILRFSFFGSWKYNNFSIFSRVSDPLNPKLKFYLYYESESTTWKAKASISKYTYTYKQRENVKVEIFRHYLNKCGTELVKY